MLLSDFLCITEIYKPFLFFRKWRKCEISEEYNAKHASEPSKTSHIRIHFSFNFHVFSRTPSQRPFLEGASARQSSKVRFWSGFRFFKGLKIEPWSSIFNQKGSPNPNFFVPEASWSRPGRDLAPKTLKGRIFDDLGSFLVDFGRILDQFGDDFSTIVH